MRISQVLRHWKFKKHVCTAGLLLACSGPCMAQSTGELPPAQQQLPQAVPTQSSQSMQYAQPVMTQQEMLGTRMGTVDRCNLSICNPPRQPSVAKGRCQPCTVAVDCVDNCGGIQG